MDSMNKKITAVLVVLLLLAAGVGGYMYYKRSPEYSLKLIQESVKKHNWDKFSQRVDVKGMSESAFDDLIDVAMEKDKTMDSGTKTLAAGFAQMLKPAVTGAIESAVKEYVEKGEVDKPKADAGKNGDKDKVGEQAADNLLEKTHAKDVNFTGVKSSDVDGDIATVTLGIKNEKLGKEFELKLSMSRLEDGTWKIKRISNLKDFMQAVIEAEEAKLAELNRPIKEELDAAVKIGAISGQVQQKDSYGFSHRLQLSSDLELSAAKPVNSISGEITVTNPKGDSSVVKYTYAVDGVASGKSKMNLSKDLNMFMDDELIKSRGQGYKYEATVTSIKYQDGTETKMLETLPE